MANYCRAGTKSLRGTPRHTSSHMLHPKWVYSKGIYQPWWKADFISHVASCSKGIYQPWEANVISYDTLYLLHTLKELLGVNQRKIEEYPGTQPTIFLNKCLVLEFSV
jgi:hypothetical protein